MIQDIHSHTYYSYCGKDAPESIVEASIAGGITLFGICDHNYGIGGARADTYAPHDAEFLRAYSVAVQKYFEHINLIREQYSDRITVLRGIEVCTLDDGAHSHYALPDGVDISFFDYCLIENLDAEKTVTHGDLFSYAQRCGTPTVGVAHTDLFAYIERLGADPLEYFSRMAKENIFWEMNVSYDSIHHYREHPYMLKFFSDESQQEIVRRSGVRVSIGFDGHKVEDYLPLRVADYNSRLAAMGIKKPFEV